MGHSQGYMVDEWDVLSPSNQFFGGSLLRHAAWRCLAEIPPRHGTDQLGLGNGVFAGHCQVGHNIDQSLWFGHLGQVLSEFYRRATTKHTKEPFWHASQVLAPVWLAGQGWATVSCLQNSCKGPTFHHKWQSDSKMAFPVDAGAVVAQQPNGHFYSFESVHGAPIFHGVSSFRVCAEFWRFSCVSSGSRRPTSVYSESVQPQQLQVLLDLRWLVAFQSVLDPMCPAVLLWTFWTNVPLSVLSQLLGPSREWHCDVLGWRMARIEFVFDYGPNIVFWCVHSNNRKK